MPQYLRLRYGGQRIRVWLALVHTLLTIISVIAVSHGDGWMNERREMQDKRQARQAGGWMDGRWMVDQLGRWSRLGRGAVDGWKRKGLMDEQARRERETNRQQMDRWTDREGWTGRKKGRPGCE